MRRAARQLARLGMALAGLAGALPAQADGAWRDVPFEVLATGESSTVAGPLLKVAGTARQAAELSRLAGPDAPPRLSAAHLRQRRIVAVFDKPAASSGHRIAVRSIRADAGTVRITITRTGPAPGQNVNDVISHPYAMVSVPAAAVPRRATWEVVDANGDTVLVQGPR